MSVPFFARALFAYAAVESSELECQQGDLLTVEEVNRCSVIAMVPANPHYSSLNLAAAVQVACYEIATAAAGFAVPEVQDRVPATTEDTEALFAHWEAAMVESGYLDPSNPGRLMERLRRMIARAGLERSEAKALRGMLAAFERRMRR